MLLGFLDVAVDKPLRLEPLVAALVGTGEWTLARVVHVVQLQSLSGGKSRRAARLSAGISMRHIGMLRCDVPLHIPSFAKRCTTISTDKWPLAKMNFVHMQLEMFAPTEELSAGAALERFLLKMDSLVVALHVCKSAKDLVAGRVSAGKLLI